MTKCSQALYTHQIMDVETCSERYSITMRHVDSKNKRSTVLIGDSNTKPVLFGAGKGLVGENYPGQRVKASKIRDIDPMSCVDFANIIIMCGTNDLRPTEIKGNPNEYINNLVCCLHEKVEQISLLCKAKIFYMPVLPTRDPTMNRFVTEFNRVVYNSEFRHRLNIHMPPLYSFLDHTRLLDIKFTRNGDCHHLGDVGLKKLVRVIKDAIYFREREVNGVKQQGHPRTPGAGSQRPA